MALEEDNLRATLEAAAAEVAERVDAADTGTESQGRDELGRFAAKDAATPENPPAVAENSPPAVENPPGTENNSPPLTTEPEAVLGVKVPESVPTDLRDKFGLLPPEWQQFMAKREADVHKQFTRQDEERNFGRQLRQVIDPYMPIINAEGGNAVAAVQSLLNTAYVLRHAPAEQKVALLREVAKQYNIPLEAASPQNAFADPQIETLQQRLDRLERERAAEAQARADQAQQAVFAEIAAFKEKAPHYDTVAQHMAALLNVGAAKDLQDAYDQACWANPDVRSTLMAEQAREAEAKRAAASAQAVAAKRQAAVSVSGSPGGASSTAPAPDRNLREELMANLAAAQGRV